MQKLLSNCFKALPHREGSPLFKNGNQLTIMSRYFLPIFTLFFITANWHSAFAQSCSAGQEFHTISHSNAPVASSGTVGQGTLPGGNTVTVTENEISGTIGVVATSSGAAATLNGSFNNTTNNIVGGGALSLSTGDNDLAEYTYTFCQPVTDPFIFVGPTGIEINTTVTVRDGSGTDIPITLIDGQTGFGVTGSTMTSTINNRSGYVQINDGVPRTVIVLRVDNQSPGGADGFDLAIGICYTPSVLNITACIPVAGACPNPAPPTYPTGQAACNVEAVEIVPKKPVTDGSMYVQRLEAGGIVPQTQYDAGGGFTLADGLGLPSLGPCVTWDFQGVETVAGLGFEDSANGRDWVQQDGWLVLPATLECLTLRIGASPREQASAIWAGKDAASMCEAARELNGTLTDHNYDIPPDLQTFGCGWKLLRVRFYTYDIRQRADSRARWDIGNGFELIPPEWIHSVTGAAADDNTGTLSEMDDEANARCAIKDANGDYWDINSTQAQFNAGTMPGDGLDTRFCEFELPLLEGVTCDILFSCTSPLIVNLAPTNPACPGDNNGSIDLTATGGTPPYSFDWADLPGNNDPEDRVNLGTGIYSVTVTDQNGTMATATTTLIPADNTPPVANCQDVSIQFDFEGNAVLTTMMVNNGSSDNCGNITMSLSQTNFDCNDIGMNTVTLTVTDGVGLTDVCTATVTVEDFVTINDVLVEHESCSGYNNGVIVIMATPAAGELSYSIDGGANVNLTGVFHSLSPGDYTVTIQNPKSSICNTTVPVTINAGPAPTTWYADIDGDNWSSGQSVVSCGRPSGYKTATELQNAGGGIGGDCNDGDPLMFPGQTWFIDQDNDNYAAAGGPLTQCLRPAGYKAASELQPGIDCDDNNAAVNPGAIEICNGIDDNCNGQVDEGVGGGFTFNGNVSLYTQAQVDAFSACYSVINGNLVIAGYGVNNLNGLSNIIQVTGNVTIQSTVLANMGGLDALATVGGTLTIYYNYQLTSLLGLEALTSVGGSLNMYYNFALVDCCAISSLLANNGVSGPIYIFYNSFAGQCTSAAQIISTCSPSPSPLLNTNGNAVIGSSWISAKKQLNLFPNPALESVNVSLKGGYEEGVLKVVDFTGRLVTMMKLDRNTSLVNLRVSDWQAGIYMVQVMLDGEQYVEKLVIR